MKWLEYEDVVARCVHDAGIRGWPSKLPKVPVGMHLYCSMLLPNPAKKGRWRLYHCRSEEELAELDRFRASSRVRDVRWVFLAKGVEITVRMARALPELSI